MLSEGRQLRRVGGVQQPFIKWPGGKRWLWKSLQPLVPGFKRYFEPFLGGGAIFFALGPTRAVLSDINPELINAYVQVRDNTERVIARLKKLSVRRKTYEEMRAAVPVDCVERAVRFIYLSKTAFNGMYRVNQRGLFNVPFAGQIDRKVFDPQTLRRAAGCLQNCELEVRDFSRSLASAQRGDFVYCDPPYTVLHNNNGFVRYNERLFSWSDQERLAELARAAVSRGAFVLVSNARTIHVRRLYTGFREILVHRTSCISAQSGSRGKVSESLFLGQPT